MKLKTLGKFIYFSACLISGMALAVAALIAFSPNVETDHERNPLFWHGNNLPIIVSMNYETEPFHLNAMRDAVNQWNIKVGMEVFVGPELMHFEENDIGTEEYTNGVFSYPVDEVGTRFKTTLYATAKKFYSVVYQNAAYQDTHVVACKVNFLRSVEQPVLTNVFIHELGHCLGFNHDWNNRSSIMFPLVFNETRYQDITEIHKNHIRNMMLKNQAL